MEWKDVNFVTEDAKEMRVRERERKTWLSEETKTV